MKTCPQIDQDRLAEQLVSANRSGTLDNFCEVNDHVFSIQTLEALGRIMNQWRLKDANSTMELAEIGNTVAEKIGTEIASGFASWLQGASYSYANQHMAAVEHFEHARCLLDDKIEVHKYLSLLTSMVGSYVFLGRSSQAIELCSLVEALVDHKNSSHLLLLAYANQNLGVLFQKQGRFAAATKCFILAKEVYERSGRSLELAGVLSNLSNVLRETGELNNAEEIVREAIHIFEQLNLEQEASRSRLSLSSVLIKTGRFYAAQRELIAARSIFSDLEQVVEIATVDLYRAVIYSYLFMHEDALFLVEAASTHFQEAGLPWYYAYATLVKGLSLKALNKKNAALSELKVAYDIFSQLHVDHLAELARFAIVDCEAFVHNSDLYTSRSLPKLLSQPLRLSSFQIQQSLLIAETAVNQNMLAEAEEIIRLLAPLAENDLERELKLLLSFVTGKLYLSKGHISAANHYFELACSEIATISSHLLTDEFKLSFAHGLKRINQEWINTTYRCFQNSGNNIVPVLVAINFTNLTTINVLTRHSATQSTQTDELSTLRRNWIQLRLEQDPLFSTLEAQKPGLEHSADGKKLLTLEKQLLDRSRLATLTYSPLDISPEPSIDDYREYFDTLKVSRDDTAQIQYFLANDEIHAIVFDPSGTRAHHCLASYSSLSRLLKAWRMTIRGRFLAENESALRTILVSLYERLIRPLELNKFSNLYFVPPPELNDLPLHACHDGSSYLVQKARVSFVNFPFSIDDKSVSNSLRISGEQTSAIVGSYSMRNRLPNTINEGLKVADLLRRRNLEVCCLPETITSQDLETNGKFANIIHLSAHGNYRRDNSVFSSMILADGPLSALQVSTMEFVHNPLVVLNACSTGTSGKRAGALQGLVRSFLMSGAGYIVANQWDVEDEVASTFMQKFYELIGADYLNPSNALQNTQSKLIDQGASINEWASYVCWQNHQRGKGD